MPVDASQLSIEGAMNGMVQNVSGSRLVSTTNATMSNQPALQGKMVIPSDGVEYESYVRLVQRDKQIFGVWTMGTDYALFESIANSFQFTQ